MTISPKHQPTLFIRNDENKKHDFGFNSSSALVFNSLFRHYNPPLANAPEMKPAPKPELKRNIETDGQHGFFDANNIGTTAEGFGDLLTGMISDSLINPATFFSQKNKLESKPPFKKNFDLEMEKKKEEALRRRQR